MNIKTVSVIKYPIDNVWTAMRDDLPKLLNFLEDIESITVKLYENIEPEITQVVNIWKASPKLPKILARRLDSNMFVWTDNAKWDKTKLECAWNIEPHHFRDNVKCSGITKFELALGGRGTRVTFSGNIEWKSKSHASVSSFMEDAVFKGIEIFVQSLIPKNFRKVIEALTKYLDSNR